MDDMGEFLGSLQGDDKDIAVRLCVPVVDAPEISSEPGSIHMLPCAICKQECWYDSTMIVPLPDDIRELVVCNHCAMSEKTLCAVLMAASWPGSAPPSWN